MMDKKVQVAFGIIIAVAIGMLVWNAGLYLSRRGLDKIEVIAIPDDSAIELDGKTISGGEIYVDPGKHTLTATRKYFNADTKHIDTRTSKGETIYLVPGANSPEALQWLSEHPEVQQNREALAGEQEASIRQQLIDKNPVITKLPVYNSHYRIDYTISKDNQLAFSVTLYPIINGPNQYNQYLQQLQQYKAEAFEFLTSNGVNTNTAKISVTPEE